jgi:hypothetical protein
MGIGDGKSNELRATLAERRAKSGVKVPGHRVSAEFSHEIKRRCQAGFEPLEP